MAEVTAPGSGEAATRATEEAAFYHEAALNAAWTGSRTALGGLSFLYGCFVFAYFYLSSSNGHSMWLPKVMGITMNERLGKIHFWTMFIAFNSTFMPLFAVGLLG